MNSNQEILSAIREFLIDQNDTKKMLSDELKTIVSENYDDNFSEFMSKEVLNEDYGSLQEEIEELYWNDFFIS